jgi:hypothetical protein
MREEIDSLAKLVETVTPTKPKPLQVSQYFLLNKDAFSAGFGLNNIGTSPLE